MSDLLHRPPSKRLLLVEPVRAVRTLAALARAWPQLREVPAGDGRPVLVLPGLINSDRSTIVLRRYLERLGYRVFGWELGRNLGARAIGPDGERLMARLFEVARQTGAPVTLIGISLGGVMARIAARRHPDLVREVITVSAPFAGPPSATNVWRAFELLTGEKVNDRAVQANQVQAAAPLPVPATAIWSRSDGFVSGHICRPGDDEPCRSVEIDSGHLWVQMHPETLRATAQVLGGDRA